MVRKFKLECLLLIFIYTNTNKVSSHLQKPGLCMVIGEDKNRKRKKHDFLAVAILFLSVKLY